MQFAQFNTLAKKNAGTRTGFKKGQSYKGFRHSTTIKGSAGFQFSEKIWEDLGLEGNGFLALQNPDDVSQVFIVVLPDTHEKVMFFKESRGENKSKQTSSTELESILIEAGLMRAVQASEAVERRPIYQNLGVEKVADFEGTPSGTVGTWKIVLVAKASNEDEAGEELNTEAETADAAPAQQETNESFATPSGSTFNV